jgi:hypothetical protein
MNERLYATEFGSDTLDFHSRLLVFDAADLLKPVLLGAYISPFDSLGYTYSLGVNFAADGLYTYHSDYIFSVVDVGRPDSMVLAGRVPGYFYGGQGGGPVLDNGRAYVDHGGYLYIIDISNPMMPDVVNPLGSSFGFSGAVLDDTLLYETTSSGLHVVSVSDPLNVYEIGNWNSSARCAAVVRHGASFFLARALEGVAIVDVANPASPILKRDLETPGYAYSVLVDDSMLYVNDALALVVFRHDATSGIADQGDALTPMSFSLGANYPNPFNSGTMIAFSQQAPSVVSLSIHNVLGQLIDKRDLGVLPAGKHTVAWEALDKDGHPLPSGVYFYRMTGAGQTFTRKMLLLR